jgi:putative restriction endonuclease
MRIYIGITDNNWYRYLSGKTYLEEVNFWVPGKKISLPQLEIGELFLFKLHSPQNFIVGGGVFTHSCIYPINLAWKVFETLNGTSTERELRDRIETYRGKEPENANYNIGCVILSQPFFWKQEDWIRSEKYWKAGTRTYKKYDMSTEIGRELWHDVHSRFYARTDVVAEIIQYGSKDRYGIPVLVKPRLGQGGFHISVTDAYDRRCAITQEKTLPALQAAHIKPFAKDGPHAVSNGILLRADIHHLLDSGYATISPKYNFEVSKHIHDDFDNGKEYYKLNGTKLYLPKNRIEHPDPEFISWHNENVFLG